MGADSQRLEPESALSTHPGTRMPSWLRMLRAHSPSALTGNPPPPVMPHPAPRKGFVMRDDDEPGVWMERGHMHGFASRRCVWRRHGLPRVSTWSQPNDPFSVSRLAPASLGAGPCDPRNLRPSPCPAPPHALEHLPLPSLSPPHAPSHSPPTHWKFSWSARAWMMARRAWARDAEFAESRLVVGSSSARMPQFRQNVSASARRMTMQARTR